LSASCAVLQNNQVVYHYAQNMPDTAFVYTLPYAKGATHRVWQGYHSLLSHHGNFAIDFKMKQGTGVYAARSGVVVYVKQSATKGGIGRRYLDAANSITIKHNDGTFAHYLHLQHNGALVSVGDTVGQGQKIGLSGSTGFSAFPHLHFEVTRGLKKATNELPVRFHTEKGAVFLQPMRRYKAI
jgi:murein DD-endopeptidase MepM/ murein hydrolase activator NlpD